MRYFLLAVICLHGLIHLLGFVKAFAISPVKELTLPISKAWGILWLLAAIQFLLTAALCFGESRYWWLSGAVAIVISQILIIGFWEDARFGTVANLMILPAVLAAFFTYNFHRETTRQVEQMIGRLAAREPMIVTDTLLTDLPSPVARWIRRSGMVGKPEIYRAQVAQAIRMQMKPEQKDWLSATAVQYYAVRQPAFIWETTVQMMPLVYFLGRDRFNGGKGQMQIQLWGAFAMVDSKDNEKINTGTMQRYLGEIVWLPSAALHPAIRWEAVDDNSARATMTYGETTGSGIFHFTPDGDLVSFNAMRYMGSEENARQHEWIITAENWRTFNGIRVPSKVRATWKLPEEDWTWLQMEITDVRYNEQVEMQ
ncbi:DUF6544 family protein [Rhodoflexus caldus]|uniref:DUF6544 family protein n=1 Tax=Rhodoflexus caldus TaxID=2891236 RepID=UPI002029BF73|nr:DUF6544 family protein [Rhodoflexus caldus]